jgi:fumarate reductase flavoprotein subunit
MSSTSVVYDVVVIGGGISGLITAVRAVQLNLCVVVLEQSIDEEYMCNSRLTSGVFHCALNTPSDSVQNLFSKIKKDFFEKLNSLVTSDIESLLF